MSLKKYESIKIPILKKTEYPTWKVKMLMHLEATDPDYLDLKEKSEWTPEEKVDVLKDVKVRKFLHNSLDYVMSNRVIAYTTSKEIWYALETQCQGTMAIKKNRRAILIQEYEHFEAKPDETLTDIYDRFLTLLNNLSLVGKMYDREDSNTKSLRALNEEWKTQTSIIRHQYDLEIITLDEVYGMLRTHDLEVQQRKERKSSKGKLVALKVNDEASKEMSVEVARKKNNLPESDTDNSSSNPDDGTDSKTDENMTYSDIMQIDALLVKGFKRMQFRKSKKNRSFWKNFTGGERKSTGRRDGKDSKAGKVDRTKLKCYNCDEPGHFATECKRTKHDKGKNKALITLRKNWMDSSDSENEDRCYALMANFYDPAFSESKKECEKAKHTEKIASGKKVHEMISKKNWKECLGYVDGIKDVDTENETTLKTHVKFISSEPDEPKSILEKGSTSASQEKLVSDKSQRKENKETIKTVKKEKCI
ncbi:hypothetical protein AgCh_018270 [Apium graveolens]